MFQRIIRPNRRESRQKLRRPIRDNKNMKLKIYAFLLISFGLHVFVIAGLSFVTDENTFNKNVVSVNLNFSKFKELDSQLNFEITKKANGLDLGDKVESFNKKLFTENEITNAANLYVSACQRQIESIANSSFIEYLNNQEPISLRLSATLYSSGELVNFELIKSSGIETIDQVAIDILKTASPFIPFSEMMNDYLEITIIRDWNFGSPKI